MPKIAFKAQPTVIKTPCSATQISGLQQGRSHNNVLIFVHLFLRINQQCAPCFPLPHGRSTRLAQHNDTRMCSFARIHLISQSRRACAVDNDFIDLSLSAAWGPKLTREARNRPVVVLQDPVQPGDVRLHSLAHFPRLAGVYFQLLLVVPILHWL